MDVHNMMLPILDVQLNEGALAAIIIGSVLAAAVATFFITRWYFNKQLEKNPPINEAMIRAMYRQMGRNPSEAQVRAIMNSVSSAAPKKDKKSKAKK